jgi:hypothetical protein
MCTCVCVCVCMHVCAYTHTLPHSLRHAFSLTHSLTCLSVSLSLSFCLSSRRNRAIEIFDVVSGAGVSSEEDAPRRSVKALFSSFHTRQISCQRSPCLPSYCSKFAISRVKARFQNEPLKRGAFGWWYTAPRCVLRFPVSEDDDACTSKNEQERMSHTYIFPRNSATTASCAPLGMNTQAYYKPDRAQLIHMHTRIRRDPPVQPDNLMVVHDAQKINSGTVSKKER